MSWLTSKVQNSIDSVFKSTRKMIGRVIKHVIVWHPWVYGFIIFIVWIKIQIFCGKTFMVMGYVKVWIGENKSLSMSVLEELTGLMHRKVPELQTLVFWDVKRYNNVLQSKVLSLEYKVLCCGPCVDSING